MQLTLRCILRFKSANKVVIFFAYRGSYIQMQLQLSQ